MTTMNISLPKQMKNWIKLQVNYGQYTNSSDYIRDLIRHDQNIQNNHQLLTQALIEGENSGISDKSVDEIWSTLYFL